MRAPLRLATLCLALWAPLPGGAESALPPLADAGGPAWHAVGRVNVAGFKRRRICTGTLVAPDRVVTAAHCVTRGDGRAVPLGDLHFVAGWHKGAHAGHARAVAVHLHPHWRGTGRSEVAADIAVIRLDAALEVAPLGFGAAGRPNGGRAILGYQASRPHTLGGSTGCGGVAVAPGHMRLDCAAAPGVSGGPVLERHGDAWRVVGVVSGGAPPGAPPRTHAALLDRWALGHLARPR